jgi:hypothetical protein
MPPLYEIVPIHSRAASAENPRALTGAGGQSNEGRKGRPCHWPFPAGETVVLLDAEGPGVVRHIWLTVSGLKPTVLRNLILRMYWDRQAGPSVEVPLGDFFGIAHGLQTPLEGPPVSMQSGRGFNCWIPMPFHRHVRITIENETGELIDMLFYQVDFTVGDPLPLALGYFHAQFRRSNPCPLRQDYTILDRIDRPGVYLGTVLGVRTLFRDAWWGEGEVKFYLDDDGPFPTICGTGTEDYMGSAWGLTPVVTSRQGAPIVDNEGGYYSIYRFHFDDPIHFRRLQRVTVQQIGYGDREKARAHYGPDYVEHPAAGAPPESTNVYMERSDDWSSLAYWYQELPTAPFPAFPNRSAREANLPEKYSAPERADIQP